MRALIDAFYGADPRALADLRRTFGVTHLLVEPKDLSIRPRYFAPFTTDVEAAWAASGPNGFSLAGAIERTTVFEEAGIVVLDLSRLDR
jgi:hypothetical protein